MDLGAIVVMPPDAEWSDFLYEGSDQVIALQASKQVSWLPEKRPITTTKYLDDSKSNKEDDQLVVSPYTSRSHRLELSSVSRECQMLARALTSMRPLRADYATAPYELGFNWASIVDRLHSLVMSQPHPSFPAQTFYIVVFRSRLPRFTDRTRLGALDREAHKEAMASGGLLKYWFGTPDRNGRNLATCIWRHRGDARMGGAGPGHAKAMQETKALYTEWKIERLGLHIGQNAESWNISLWRD